MCPSGGWYICDVNAICGTIKGMEPVFILFLIFGICLILAAGWICILKDPRDSIFFVRAHSLRKKDLEGAKKDARLTAKYVAIVGVCIIVLSILVGLLVTAFMP